jgi:hypothetical protein
LISSRQPCVVRKFLIDETGVKFVWESIDFIACLASFCELVYSASTVLSNDGKIRILEQLYQLYYLILICNLWTKIKFYCYFIFNINN